MITLQVTWWVFSAYLLMVFCSTVGIALMAYRKGRAVGRAEGEEIAAEMFEHPTATPRRFRQRTAEADPRRRAHVAKGRIMARRQPPPEPRR